MSWRSHVPFSRTSMKWARKVFELLHSLTGKLSGPRRTCLAELLKDMMKDPTVTDIERGLLIHAYGDAFAHTTTDFGGGPDRAMGWPLGHGAWNVTGQSPDQIRNNPDRYNAFAGNLYHILSGGAPQKNLEGLRDVF